MFMINDKSRPDNWSEKYIYYPTVEDYLKAYQKNSQFKKRSKNTRRMVFWIFFPIWFFVSFGFYGTISDTAFYGIFFVISFGIWLLIRLIHPLCIKYKLSKEFEKNPFLNEQKTISFDGFHFIIESDHMIQMFPIKNNVEISMEKTGIFLKCPDGIRFYPIRVFGPESKMIDFYERLNWDKVYNQKYR